MDFMIHSRPLNIFRIKNKSSRTNLIMFNSYFKYLLRVHKVQTHWSTQQQNPVKFYHEPLKFLSFSWTFGMSTILASAISRARMLYEEIKKEFDEEPIYFLNHVDWTKTEWFNSHVEPPPKTHVLGGSDFLYRLMFGYVSRR